MVHRTISSAARSRLTGVGRREGQIPNLPITLFVVLHERLFMAL
jgi:hypothetical protein